MPPERSNAEEIEIENKKPSNSNSKNKPKSKLKSKSDKPITVKDQKDEEEKDATGSVWNHKETLYLIDEIRHQMDLGRTNDGGLKTEAWKVVRENFNAKFKMNVTLKRIKNHVQRVRNFFFPSFIIQMTLLIILFYL
jgi:hypothetical protein